MTSTIKTFDTLYEPPVFQWAGTDPAANGWTKHGSGTTAASGNTWQINTLTSNAATYYSHNFWFNNPFVDGLSLMVQPPTIIATDGAALPNKSVIVACDDGTHRYELEFDSVNVYLNGGAARSHNNQKVWLKIAAGGLTADLEIATHIVESGTAYIAGSATELVFGDKATTDDSNTTWTLINWWPGVVAEGDAIIVPSLTVKCFDATLDAAISDITDSDGDAIFPVSTLAVAADTLVRGRVVSSRGAAAYMEVRSE